MALEQDIIDLFTPIIGGTVIYEDQNAPRPQLPYTTLKINSMRRVGGDHYSDVTDAGIQTVKGDREFTLNIQRYDKAFTVCSFLQNVIDKLNLYTNQDKFSAKKIIYVDANTVMDLSYITGEVQTEKRASVDLTMRYKSTLTDNVGVIDTVNLEADDNSTAPPYIIDVVNVL